MLTLLLTDGLIRWLYEQAEVDLAQDHSIELCFVRVDKLATLVHSV